MTATVGHLLNDSVEVWRPSTVPDEGGGQVVTYTQVGVERARLSQPSTSTRRNVDEQEADQPHAELTHQVYLAPGADVRRGDELRQAGLVLRVVATVTPSVPAYLRADAVSRQEE